MPETESSIYLIKEIYYTLQGEGAHAGRPAVFCRFSGCNLWSGREEDRARAVCSFCDTDFRGTDGPGGGRYQATELARKIQMLWPPDATMQPFVVCTGGEPLLQLDQYLIDIFHQEGMKIAIETNGTIQVPTGIDWICVSPKAGSELVQMSGQELKLVYPQAAAMPERFTHLEFDHFYLQPMDGPDQAENIRLATDYCLKHPQWHLSLQTHKLIGIP